MNKHALSKLKFNTAGLTLVLGVFACKEPPSEVPEPLQPTTIEAVTEEQPTLEISDDGITAAVERQLVRDHLTPVFGIEVTTTDGIVELSGTVDNLLAKTRATRLAEVVKGVRSVSNRIKVEADPVEDAKLADNVTSALLYDPVAESYEIKVAADNGKITLTGAVESWAEKQIAEQVAASVRGVAAIDNQITVKEVQDRPDVEIAREIEKLLDRDVLIDARQIEVAVTNGQVKLSGVVGSAAERTRAAAEAWTAGVTAVETGDLQISPLAADPDLRTSRFELRSADEIAEAIKDAALHDPRVLSYEIRPVVRGRVVTLYGVVDNLDAKNAAEQLARNTVGVSNVINEIEVVPPGELDDEDIATTIRARLLTNVYTDRHQIEVSVDDRVVTLSGTVDSYFEKAEAADIAGQARGVVAVDNLLQVEDPDIGYYFEPYLYPYYPYSSYWHTYVPPSSTSTDVEIEDSIESELFWSPFVDADQVQVSVLRGKATLTGTVDSWRARSAAAQNAYEGGALSVENLLHVRK